MPPRSESRGAVPASHAPLTRALVARRASICTKPTGGAEWSPPYLCPVAADCPHKANEYK